MIWCQDGLLIILPRLFQLDFPPLLKLDSPTVLKLDSPTVLKLDSPTVQKLDFPSLFKLDSPTELKLDSPTLLKRNSPSWLNKDSLLLDSHVLSHTKPHSLGFFLTIATEHRTTDPMATTDKTAPEFRVDYDVITIG